MFMADAELQELTGYQRRAEQCAWLRANGIRYALDRWRRPRVLRSEVERALSSEGDAAARPDFSAIRRTKAS